MSLKLGDTVPIQPSFDDVAVGQLLQMFATDAATETILATDRTGNFANKPLTSDLKSGIEAILGLSGLLVPDSVEPDFWKGGFPPWFKLQRKAPSDARSWAINVIESAGPPVIIIIPDAVNQPSAPVLPVTNYNPAGYWRIAYYQTTQELGGPIVGPTLKTVIASGRIAGDGQTRTGYPASFLRDDLGDAASGLVFANLGWFLQTSQDGINWSTQPYF